MSSLGVKMQAGMWLQCALKRLNLQETVSDDVDDDV
jgi:hypothetical protein